jgi:hypothetical protein
MNQTNVDYERLYLGGIVFFNLREFFEAHEVWEALWLDCAGAERRFYQGLIQAAVGLHHYGNGNVRGAAKLYRSSRDYMMRYSPRFLGLDIEDFWRRMEVCFRPVLESTDPDRGLRPVEELIPTIELDPPPARWPEPSEFADLLD